MNHGVEEKNMLFLNVVSCPEGLNRLYKERPGVKVLTCSIDLRLNEHKYIVPGVGDFVDRFYHT